MKLTKTLILIAALALGACTPQTTVDDVPDHQPANPKTWSPAGKVYVCHDTYENSPAEDKYWAWVLNFINDDSIVMFETPNRDLSYNEQAYCVVFPDGASYTLDYPNVTIKSGADYRYCTFVDTTKISDWLGNTYTIHN